EHLPDRSTVIFEDSDVLELAHDEHEAQADERREELRTQGLATAAFTPPYVPRDALERAAAARGSVRVRPATDSVRLGWAGVTSYASRLDTFLRDVTGPAPCRRRLVPLRPEARRSRRARGARHRAVRTVRHQRGRGRRSRVPRATLRRNGRRRAADRAC